MNTMEPYADASCILRVDIHCDACKSKMVEVMSSVSGPYSISIDGEKNQLKICGEVDPNRLLAALSRTGKHAQIVDANLKHPALRLTTNNNSAYRHGGSANPSGGGYSMYGGGYGPGPRYAAIHQSYQAFPVRGGGGALPPPSPYYPYDYTPRYVRPHPFHF